MIRLMMSALILTASLSAQALEPKEFVENYARQSGFERAQSAYELCENIFATAGTAAYDIRLQLLGQYYSVQPEAAYMALSTCQSMWVTKYLDPIRVSQITGKDRALVAKLIAGADLLYSHLPEEIRLWMQILPKDTSIPRSPYEILTPLAASERQMNETLHREMREAAKTVVKSTGYIAAGIKGTKAFFSFISGASQAAGRLVKQALLIAILAESAGAAADQSLWYVRESTMVNQVNALAAKINNPDGTPLEILLDEYYKAQQRLGFLYNYEVYLAENGGGTSVNSVAHKCVAQVKEFFKSGKNLSPCRDAATTWILAAQFLNARLPNNPEAEAVSTRLLSRAKLALWQHEEEYQLFLKNLPVCQPVYSPIFSPSYYENCQARAAQERHKREILLLSIFENATRIKWMTEEPQESGHPFAV